MAGGEGPDFLCIGLQKAGTQWLYDQLQHHPDFWMPPIKELHYFDLAFPTALEGQLRLCAADPDAMQAQRAARRDRPLDARDAAFFAAAAAVDPDDRSLDAYARLFAPKGPLLSGDITPGYSALPAETVEAIAARFDRALAILIVRDPVERVWSQWRMHLETTAARRRPSRTPPPSPPSWTAAAPRRVRSPAGSRRAGGRRSATGSRCSSSTAWRTSRRRSAPRFCAAWVRTRPSPRGSSPPSTARPAPRRAARRRSRP
ncbi:MAG: sulfotransferase [Caulobacteraceae bacterium]